METDEFSPYSDDRRKIIEESRDRQERVELATEKSIGTDFILSVETSEVRYVLHPKAFPWPHVDLTKLYERLKTKFKLTCTRLDDLGDQSANSIRKALRSGETTLQFSDGLFDLKDAPSVNIALMTVDFESITVTVHGLSDVAEAVAEEVLETMWDVAGEPRAWSSLSDDLQLKYFATNTRVKLGFGFEELLNERLVGFFRDRVITKGGFAAKMLPSGRMTRTDVSSIVGGMAVDDINLRINVFDTNSGENETKAIKFRVMRKSDYGTDAINVITMLPFDDHVSMVAELLTKIKPAALGS